MQSFWNKSQFFSLNYYYKCDFILKNSLENDLQNSVTYEVQVTVIFAIYSYSYHSAFDEVMHRKTLPFYLKHNETWSEKKRLNIPSWHDLKYSGKLEIIQSIDGVQSCTVLSVSLLPHGLQPGRLLCIWDCPGKNTGVGCHSLLQGILLTQGSSSFFTTGEAINRRQNSIKVRFSVLSDTFTINMFYS